MTFKVGDKVRATATLRMLTKDNIYTVSEARAGQVSLEEFSSADWWFESRFELVAPIRVGDKVSITGEFTVTEIGNIDRPSSPYFVYKDDKNFPRFAYLSDWKVTVTEPAETETDRKKAELLAKADELIANAEELKAQAKSL